MDGGCPPFGRRPVLLFATPAVPRASWKTAQGVRRKPSPSTTTRLLATAIGGASGLVTLRRCPVHCLSLLVTCVLLAFRWRSPLVLVLDHCWSLHLHLRCVPSEPRLTPPRGAAPFPTTARLVGRLSLGRPSRRLGMATRTRTRRTLTRRGTTRRTRTQPRPRSAASCSPSQRYRAHFPRGVSSTPSSSPISRQRSTMGL